MSLKSSAVCLALIALSIPMGAQPPATPQPAPAQTLPDAGAPLTKEQVDLLQQKIDAGTIDVERLREFIIGETEGESLRLSLQEAIRITLESNPDLQVVRLEQLKSDADLMTARGEFDPLLSGQALYLRATQETSPEYRTFGAAAAVDVYRTTSNVSVSGKLHTGTVYNVGFDLNKEETTFNNFIEEWNGGLTLTLSQPLLKGRGNAVNLTRVNLAKNAQQTNELQARLTIMNTIAQLTKSYWDLVGTIGQLNVRRQALANAERLLEISQKQVNLGTAAAIEVLQAKAGVATSQSQLIAARSQVSDAEDLLKRIMNLRDEDGIFSAQRIEPTDRPSAPELDIDKLKEMADNLDDDITKALQIRPDILTAQIAIKDAELQRQSAANDMQPQLDITGSVFQGARNHYMSQVFYGVRERNDNFYNIGVKGSVPIGNRAARGQYQRARLTKQQAEERLEKTKQDVMMNVRVALRSLETNQVLIESTKIARKLQETNVAAEEKRLRLGVSTSYKVLQIQQDLTQAQTQEVQAQVAYQKALVDLRLAEGDLLEAIGVEVAPPVPQPTINFFRSVLPCPPTD